ncbi:MAG: hypothetical protein BJ554DRAFT_6552 [Olpidium bornovanus]|uniref:Uncharacterized protein n=1 Tax=Olpidium bornovanus TaxID=278681 RepID=A0A8H7ZXJ2_9FUNG|nr:MAG: hypothetical protein BJ554DRAFT_6552 [Olpidium bornovanus]
MTLLQLSRPVRFSAWLAVGHPRKPVLNTLLEPGIQLSGYPAAGYRAWLLSRLSL